MSNEFEGEVGALTVASELQQDADRQLSLFDYSQPCEHNWITYDGHLFNWQYCSHCNEKQLKEYKD